MLNIKVLTLLSSSMIMSCRRLNSSSWSAFVALAWSSIALKWTESRAMMLLMRSSAAAESIPCRKGSLSEAPLRPKSDGWEEIVLSMEPRERSEWSPGKIQEEIDQEEFDGMRMIKAYRNHHHGYSWGCHRVSLAAYRPLWLPWWWDAGVADCSDDPPSYHRAPPRTPSRREVTVVPGWISVIPEAKKNIADEGEIRQQNDMRLSINLPTRSSTSIFNEVAVS